MKLFKLHNHANDKVSVKQISSNERYTNCGELYRVSNKAWQIRIQIARNRKTWVVFSEWVSEWVSVLLLIVIILRFCSIIRDVLDRDCSRDACKATRNWVHKSRRIIIIQAPLYNHHYHLSFCLVPSLQLSPRPRFDCLDAWRKRDSVQGPYIHKSYCFLCVDRGQNVPREWNMCLNIIMSRAIITLLFCGVILSELLLNFKQTN